MPFQSSLLTPIVETNDSILGLRIQVGPSVGSESHENVGRGLQFQKQRLTTRDDRRFARHFLKKKKKIR